MYMSATDRRLWAKEEVMSGIDTRIKEIRDTNTGDLFADDRQYLLEQRTRIAKYLGLQVDEISCIRGE